MKLTAKTWYPCSQSDAASKSHELTDYSACVTALVCKDDIYILYVIKDRLDYPELKKKIISMRKHWKTDTFLIEDKGSGTGLIADPKSDGIRSIGIIHEADKVVRMSTCPAKIEDGSVLLPKDVPWMDDLEGSEFVSSSQMLTLCFFRS